MHCTTIFKTLSEVARAKFSKSNKWAGAAAIVASAFIAMAAHSPPSNASGVPGADITSYYRNGSFVLPTDTNPLITATGFAHYVRLPADPIERRSALVVFLGGSQSLVPSYTNITQEAAIRGYGAIDLAYMDAQVAGVACSPQPPALAASPLDCYGQFHGEVAIGRGQAYDPMATTGYGAALYTMAGQGINPFWVPIAPADSIIGRLVSLLEYLSHSDAYFDSGASQGTINADHRYWSGFLTDDASSPYSAFIEGTTYRAYPNWSRIVMAGHSQGGAHAAFIGSHLPVAVKAVVLFSAPQDSDGDQPATWIRQASTTPVQNYWGVRNGTNDQLRTSNHIRLHRPGVDSVANSSSSTESTLGDFVMTNWELLASSGVGGTINAGTEYVLSNAGACLSSQVCRPGSNHRLVITSSSRNKSAIAYHNSTAVDGSYEVDSTEFVWDFVFNAAGGS